MRGSVLTCAFAAVLLAGCTGLSQHLANAIERDHVRTQHVLADTRDGHARVAESSDGVIVSDGIWLSGTPMQLAREGALPAVFSQPATFDREVGSLREFAEHVSRLSHIATRVAPDAAGGTQPASTPAPSVPVLGASPPPLPSVPGLSGDTGARPGGASPRTRIGYRDGALREQVMSDPHSPAIFRVNGPLPNMDAWYDAFNVHPGDKLFIKPEDRVSIW